MSNGEELKNNMASNDRRYVIGKNLLMVVMTVVGLFSALMFLSNSWVKIVIIGLIVVMSIVWLVSHGLLRRTLKYTLFVVMIFSICFSAFEGYLFWNAGYPPTFGTPQPDVTLSYQNILNASLTEVVQSAKNTLTYKLFMLEHPGKAGIQTVTLDTTLFRGGRIEVEFNSFSSSWVDSIRFTAVDGRSYHTTVTSVTLAKLYSSPLYYQPQTQEEAIQQIDNLGLQWYYDRAVEAYKNKIGAAPEINSLKISFQCEDYNDYFGSTLLMIGSYENNNRGNGVFFANFQPDGTLNYFNTAN
jgi:hypothetical protein